MSIQRDRNIRKSVLLRVRNLLTTPPSGSGLNAYTVYTEEQLRQVTQKTLTPVRPSVFLVDSFIKPAEPALPLVVVEVPGIRQSSFEVGNRSGRRTEVYIHVIGRMRGERDDIASFLVDQFGVVLKIYDFTSGQVFLEDGVVEDGIDIEPIPLRQDELRTEGSYENWNMIRLFVSTKN